MSNVKLGIRVRPFTERELKGDKERVPVVNIEDDNTVTITNVKVSVSGAGDSRERVRRYFADYTFDSACASSCPSYASQQKVFDTIGRAVIESISRGSSACVLAYGQSATGKTHTMIGSEAEPGLVPRICRALVDAHPVDLTVSFLEIYNERVHDLLTGETAPSSLHSLPRRRGNARKDLRVREHPQKGPYVQNLRRVAITDVEALLSLVTEGSRRRRTAATRRNSSSSRSHALLELTTPHATLHLADLAGSEKAGWEGCGGRQKEGANINKSLVALSNVISALVSGGSGRGRFVPYRDSALTWLLKDCFTGGGSTFIIATVSPSVACYGDSASTLRWAAHARQLPPVRPGTAAANSRAAVHSHYKQLLAELARNYIQFVPETGKIKYDENHWKLSANNLVKDNTEETAKIGNIMNLLKPKAGVDANSESTASSVASGSSDIINTMDKNTKITISDEINKEVNILFGPALERTRSNSDLKVIAPLRHKRRQYKSQEVLPIDKKFHTDQPTVINHLPSQSEAKISVFGDMNKTIKSSQTPILYDSQRAEIVSSVTERLYNKIKKKEEAAASKMESVFDKKIMEPLSELRICTNARQRLVDISQKALRNKRRIGIPAHTQTRKLVTRVKDQAVDAQTDLEAYYFKNRNLYTLRRDAATETIPMTPRCKEIAVGSKSAMLNFHDRSTITEGKKVVHRNSLVMTDIVGRSDRSTQTQVIPPPRRKKRVTCCNCKHNNEKYICIDEDSAPVISINISQAYPVDSETQSSDEISDSLVEVDIKTPSVGMTPDLLTNHNTVDLNIRENKYFTMNQPFTNEEVNGTCHKTALIEENENPVISSSKESDDFTDSDDCSLPRVTVDCSKKNLSEDIKDMILGRNEDLYPYNIILSPPRERDLTKRLVKFTDDKVTIPVTSAASQTNWDRDNENCIVNEPYNRYQSTFTEKADNEIQDKRESVCSDTTESSKEDTDSFIWRKGGGPMAMTGNRINSLGRSYTPVYRSKGSKYAKAKAKLYREFLGLDKEIDQNGDDPQNLPHISSKDVSSSDSAESREVANSMFKQRKTYLEDKLKFRQHPDSFKTVEQEMLKSCNSLEISVNRYESYWSNYHSDKNSRRGSLVRTPTEYLQHLVQLRREVVKADCDTESSVGHIPM